MHSSSILHSHRLWAFHSNATCASHCIRSRVLRSRQQSETQVTAAAFLMLGFNFRKSQQFWKIQRSVPRHDSVPNSKCRTKNLKSTSREPVDQPPGIPNPTQNPKACQCYATNPGKQIPGLAVLVGKVSGWLFATEGPADRSRGMWGSGGFNCFTI